MESVLILAEAPPPGQQSALGMFVPLIFIGVIFYFLLIRPARKRQKELDALVTNLKPGDRILTTGGIYGTVAAVTGDRIQLRVADQVRIDISKNAVAGLDAAGEA